MIEMMLGAMVMALLVKAVPAAIVDTITTLRAATAGEWGLIDKERDRKHQRSASRREAVSKAWQATRARRNKKAGGDGNYRPGMAAYLGDVYHGLWEDKLEQRHAKRAARPTVGPDGRRPAVGRLDQALEAKVGRQREKTGLFGRAARLLFDPVGERRQPADVVPSAPDVRDTGNGGVYGQPSDPWAPTGAGDEPTMDLGDSPRIACPVCGETLTRGGDSWRHPIGSACTSAGEPSAPQPATPATPPPVEGQVLETARPAMAKADPAGRGGPEARDAAFADVYNSHPGVDMDVIDHALMQADQDNRRRAANDRHTNNETTDPTSNGGTDMPDTDLLDYNQAIAEHEAALEHLGAQSSEAVAFKQSLIGSTANVENMDAGRDRLAQALAPLAEGMEGSRFGADASAGSAEAAGALSAGSIAAVQEHLEAANDTNDRWIAELDAATEAVQASLRHLKSTYGEAAATVQETGVDARALAEH